MSVHIRKLPNGDHQLGGEIEGVFVAFATLSAGKVAQFVQRGEILNERAEAGDELARDQIGEPITGKSKSRSSNKTSEKEG